MCGLSFTEIPLKYEAILEAVNLYGSDTDTISAFAGALLGAKYGTEIIPLEYLESLQDADYLAKVATRLYRLKSPTVGDKLSKGVAPNTRDEAYLKILAWEIGLHEMFWDALEVGGHVIHPTLGRGQILGKDLKEIPGEMIYGKVNSH